MPEIVDKIHNIVLANCQIRVNKIEKTVSISYERVHILHNELSQVLKKLSASWIPHLLNPKQKRIWIQTSDCLKMFKKNPKNFMLRFKIMDEIWIYSTSLFERANKGHKCLFWGFRKKSRNYFRKGIEKLEKYWTKCEFREDIEK